MKITSEGSILLVERLTSWDNPEPEPKKPKNLVGKVIGALTPGKKNKKDSKKNKDYPKDSGRNSEEGTPLLDR